VTDSRLWAMPARKPKGFERAKKLRSGSEGTLVLPRGGVEVAEITLLRISPDDELENGVVAEDIGYSGGDDGAMNGAPPASHFFNGTDGVASKPSAEDGNRWNAFVEAVGAFAGMCTTAAFLPQVYDIWLSGDTSGLSLPMYIIFVTGVSMWIFYGVLKKAASLVLANMVTFVLSGYILTAIIINLAHEDGETFAPPLPPLPPLPLPPLLPSLAPPPLPPG
jgi:MtN3 and saliva related transmembrane protein